MNIPVVPALQALDIAQVVGTRFRQVRKSKGLTLKVLARTSGVDLATISRIERGRMVGTLESHLRLSHALGLTLAKLYAPLQVQLYEVLEEHPTVPQPRRLTPVATHR